MKWLSPFRVATYLLVFFFVGHTVGGMLSQQSLGPEADAVFASMRSVHFDFNGSDSTYYGFWFGFGLMVSIFLAFSAVVAWRLDGVSAKDWPIVAPIAWALCAGHACTAVLSWAYFFAGPGLSGTLITLALAVGAWKKHSGAAQAGTAPRPA